VTTLVDARGQLLTTSLPGVTAPYGVGMGVGVGGQFASRPLWSSGEQSDAFGFHDGSAVPVPFDVLYRSQPVVAAVVNKLARQIATTPLNVYRMDEDGDHVLIRSDMTEDAGSSLASLLEKPTPRFGGVHFKQWIALPSLIYGNALLAKYRGAGKGRPPTELIPMDWRYIQAYAFIGGPVEVWQTTQLGSPMYVDVLATTHFAWGNPSGPIGVSPLQQLAVTVALEDAAQRWQTSSFKNAARPSSAITLPQGANPTVDQMKLMRETVTQMHGGVDNAFKVALLAPGATWVPMGFNMQEAELMTARKFNRDEVCMVYDVKPSHIGDMSTPGAGYGSVVEVNRDLYRTTLRPWFRMIEETIKVQLIDDEPDWEGLHVEFDMSEMLLGEPEALAAELVAEVDHGLRTHNEGRKKLRLARVETPEADQLWIQANNMRPIGTPEDAPVQEGALPLTPAERITETITAPAGDTIDPQPAAPENPAPKKTP
jgi:HK97 family phage portal protein